MKEEIITQPVTQYLEEMYTTLLIDLFTDKTIELFIVRLNKVCVIISYFGFI